MDENVQTVPEKLKDIHRTPIQTQFLFNYYTIKRAALSHNDFCKNEYLCDDLVCEVTGNNNLTLLFVPLPMSNKNTTFSLKASIFVTLLK